MISALHMAMWSAIVLAMCGAVFGVCVARLLWADDLKQAQTIDAIRSDTEASLRKSIAAMDRTIRILQHEPPAPK